MGIEGDLAALSFSGSGTRSLCRFGIALCVPGIGIQPKAFEQPFSRSPEPYGGAILPKSGAILPKRSLMMRRLSASALLLLELPRPAARSGVAWEMTGCPASAGRRHPHGMRPGIGRLEQRIYGRPQSADNALKTQLLYLLRAF